MPCSNIRAHNQTQYTESVFIIQRLIRYTVLIYFSHDYLSISYLRILFRTYIFIHLLLC
jgi:hypothetical protein